jgi:protein-tyrosine phosphatase
MNFSRINDRLFVGTTPGPNDYRLLHDLGVRLVINMRVERRPHPNPYPLPIQVLWLPTFDTPLLPIPIRTLHRGVSAALHIYKEGGGVYTHCAFGMHRSVAMCAAILIATGNTIEEAIHLIKQRRSIADPTIWYIRQRIERFAATWPCSLPDCRCL